MGSLNRLSELEKQVMELQRKLKAASGSASKERELLKEAKEAKAEADAASKSLATSKSQVTKLKKQNKALEAEVAQLKEDALAKALVCTCSRSSDE